MEQLRSSSSGIHQYLISAQTDCHNASTQDSAAERLYTISPYLYSRGNKPLIHTRQEIQPVHDSWVLSAAFPVTIKNHNT